MNYPMAQVHNETYCNTRKGGLRSPFPPFGKRFSRKTVQYLYHTPSMLLDRYRRYLSNAVRPIETLPTLAEANKTSCPLPTYLWDRRRQRLVFWYLRRLGCMRHWAALSSPSFPGCCPPSPVGESGGRSPLVMLSQKTLWWLPTTYEMKTGVCVCPCLPGTFF